MATHTVENYVKKLYAEERGAGGHPTPTGRLAAAMGVTPGTATAMAKSLALSGLVEYEPRVGVRLSDSGRTLALRVLRRHRLVELFLVQCLHLDWSEVHEEAEAWEHVISERVIDRIDELLGFPSTDPHGAPIPSASGDVSSPELVALSHCVPGEDLLLRRVAGQDSAFLVYLDQNGLRPGESLRILHIEHAADAMTLLVSERPAPLTLGLGAAERILVERISS
jgi:DtxR family Mn-dependent transcriptional regulator